MKYSDQIKPTLRKRTLKIVARDKDSFELHYMNSYQWGLTKEQVITELANDLDVIGSWGEAFVKENHVES